MEAASIRPKRRLRFALLVTAAVGAVGACWWGLSADHLDLDIPTPPHTSGFADIWNETSRSEVRYTYPSSSGRDYVLRRVGSVYPDRHEWKSQEDVVAHFDRWLTAHGWVVRGIDAEGDPVIAEATLLSRGPPGTRHYTRSGDPWGDEYRVAVAVWPIRSGGRVLGFNVVVETVRPSFLRRLQRSFD